MLYERWRQVADSCRSELALVDLRDGKRWTFGQLAEAPISPPAESVCFPQGICAQFVFAVLQAWKSGRGVCPLEVGQAPPPIPELPSGIAHVKSTSATTGVSSLVIFRAEQLAADADHIVRTMGLRPDWPNLGAISLAHSYGFSNLVLPLLLHGIPLILLDCPLPEAVRHACEAFSNLTLPGVPALWRAWHEAGILSTQVRLAISAGAPLPLLLEAEVFQSCGLKIHNFYGSTECGGIAYDGSLIPRTDAALAGAPMSGVEVSADPMGCLEVRGDAVGESHWPVPRESLGQGVFRSQDLVDLRDGLVYIRGRVSDQINVAGRKLSPDTVERVLMESPGVRDCLVFGVPSRDAERGEEVVVCVETGEAVDVLKQYLLSRLPTWQMPRDWWVVDSLGVNQRGKRSRAEWRRMYLEKRS